MYSHCRHFFPSDSFVTVTFLIGASFFVITVVFQLNTFYKSHNNLICIGRFEIELHKTLQLRSSHQMYRKTYCMFPITTECYICSTALLLFFLFPHRIQKTNPFVVGLLLSAGWCYNEDARSLLETERWGRVVMHLMRPIPVSPPPRWGEPSLQERTKSTLYLSSFAYYKRTDS